MIVICPDCGGQSEAPDGSQGKRLQCPSCNSVFTAAFPKATVLDSEPPSTPPNAPVEELQPPAPPKKPGPVRPIEQESTVNGIAPHTEPPGKSVPFQCPKCQKRYSVPLATVGKRARCRDCREIVVVSVDTPSPPTQSSPHKSRQGSPETGPQAPHTDSLLDAVRTNVSQGVPPQGGRPSFRSAWAEASKASGLQAEIKKQGEKANLAVEAQRAIAADTARCIANNALSLRDANLDGLIAPICQLLAKSKQIRQRRENLQARHDKLESDEDTNQQSEADAMEKEIESLQKLEEDSQVQLRPLLHHAGQAVLQGRPAVPELTEFYERHNTQQEIASSAKQEITNLRAKLSALDQTQLRKGKTAQTYAIAGGAGILVGIIVLVILFHDKAGITFNSNPNGGAKAAKAKLIEAAEDTGLPGCIGLAKQAIANGESGNWYIADSMANEIGSRIPDIRIAYQEWRSAEKEAQSTRRK
jgi:hypothetical protein